MVKGDRNGIFLIKNEQICSKSGKKLKMERKDGPRVYKKVTFW